MIMIVTQINIVIFIIINFYHLQKEVESCFIMLSLSVGRIYHA